MKPEQNFLGKFTIETGAETVGRKLQTEIQLLSGGDSGTTDAEFGFSGLASHDRGYEVRSPPKAFIL